MITETLGGNGSWNIALKPDASRHLAHLVRRSSYFGIIRIFTGRVDLDSADAVAPIYEALMTTSEDMLTASGIGLTAYLGEDGNDHQSFDDRGMLYIGGIGGNWDLPTWISSLAPYMPMFTIDASPSVSGSGDAHAAVFAWSTPRRVLDWICDTWQLDWCLVAGRHIKLVSRTDESADPVAIATEGGGRDPGQYGIDAARVYPTIDFKDLDLAAVTKIVTEDPDTGVSSADYHTGGAGPGIVKAIDGTDITLWHFFDGVTDTALKIEAGQSLLGEVAPFSLDVNELAITERVKPGDYLNVDVGSDDPIASTTGIADWTPQMVEFRGIFRSVIKLRATSINWPIEKGMTVMVDTRFASFGSGDLIDITEHIEWEDTGASIELGAYKATVGTAIQMARR